uniref:Uncharacterized protein n=1 Tax=Gouania willdenowi TaxID=441366 RepID=A0A8C5I483_GOUWI
MATPGKSAKKEAKKPIQSKTSLISPFTSEWSPLPQKDMHFILQTLKDKLLSTGLEKKEEKGFRPWRKKLHQEKPAAVAAAVMESEPQMGEVFQGCVSSKNGWTNLTARRQLAIGINEVTKALERNELRLLLVLKHVLLA